MKRFAFGMIALSIAIAVAASTSSDIDADDDITPLMFDDQGNVRTDDLLAVVRAAGYQ